MSGTNAVSSLTSAENLTVSGGSLTVANGYSNTAATNVQSGTLTLGGASSMGTLGLSGGTLGGTGTVDVSGLTTWSSGTMTGAGITNANGGVDFTGNSFRSLSDGRTLNLDGTSTFERGSLYLSGGSAVNNAGTFNDVGTASGTLIYGDSSDNTFTNTGTYNKTSVGTTTIDVAFDNTGTVDVGAGTLSLTGGGTVGTTTVASGATLSFGGGTFAVDGAGLTSSGTIAVASGTVNTSNTLTTDQLAISGGMFNADGPVSVGTLGLSSGTLGGTGTVDVSALTTWSSGGTMTGAGITNANGGVDFSGNSTRNLSGGRTLNLDGTSTFEGGNLYLSGGSAVNNAGTFNDVGTAGGTLIYGDSSGNTFTNTGAYNKTSVGTTTIGVAFDNTGTVDVGAGTLNLTGGGTVGTTTVASGATLRFGGGTFAVVGAGLTSSGTIAVASGAVNTSNALTTDQLAISGGMFNADGPVSVGTLGLSGGTLGGTGTVDISGLTTWSSGTMAEAGITNANGGVDFTNNSTRYLSGGRTLNLDGTSTFEGGNLYLSGGSAVNNAGTFNDVGAASSRYIYGDSSSNTFSNTGTYNKTSVGTTTIDVAFDNTGTVNVGAGTLSLQNPGNLAGDTLTGGTWQVQAGGGSAALQLPGNVYTNAATIVLGGANSQLLNGTGGDALAGFNDNQGAFTIQDGRAFSAPAGGFSNSGTFASESGATAAFAGTVTNTGTLRADGGTISANGGIGGNGSAVIAGAGVLNIGAASTVGTLTHNGGAGSQLALGSNSLTITTDYDNANFGTGNAFNARSNVTGSGGIIGQNAAISITGSAVISTGADSYTMNLGNIRGGSTVTREFRIVNSGTGADIRGAIQTGGITDARLSGSAIVAGGSNFGPVAAGASTGPLSVTFDTSSAGGSLSGQSLAVVSNFSNLETQTINLEGGITTLAVGSATPSSSPVVLDNFRVGGAGPTQSFGVQNTITAGPGSEQLGIGSVSTSGNFAADNLLGNGLIAAGGSQAGAVTTSVSNGVAGINTGTLTIQYTSNGQLIDPTFGTIDSNVQTISLQASGYNVANPTLSTNTVDFGNYRVGATLAQNVTVANTAVGPAGFQEGLDASATASGAATATGVPVVNLAAGAAPASFTVGLASAAGFQSGQVNLALASNGTGSSGLATLALPGQTIDVSGTGYQAAVGQLNVPTTLDFGTVQIGQSVSQVLSISNAALGPVGYVEDLNVRFGGASGTGAGLIGGTGQIAGLLAGATDATSMTVSVNTSAAAIVNGDIAINYFSAGAVNGVDNGLGELGVGSDAFGVSGTIQATGQVVNQASPQIDTPSIALGNVRVGDASPQVGVSVTNVATVAPQAALSATITGNAPITATGAISLLDPGQTSTDALQVGMNTATAGAINGTATIAFVSDASNIGNCGPNCALSLGTQNVSVSGNVYQVAQANLTTAVDVGNLRIGDTASQSVAVSNVDLAPAGFQEGLNATGAGSSGAAFANGAIVNLAQGDTSDLTVGRTATAAGLQSDTVQVALASNGAGTSGLATLDLGSAAIAVSSTGYRTANNTDNPVVATDVITLNARVGDTSPVASVTVTNTSPDVYTEHLNVATGAAPAGFDVSGAVTGLVAGASSSAISITLDTSVSGATSGTLALNYVSSGVGTTGAADLAVGSGSVLLNGQVFAAAIAQVDTGPIDFGIVHVGDIVALRDIELSNIAELAALNDTLLAQLTVTGDGFDGSGGLAAGGLDAQQTEASAFQIGLSTAVAGVYDGRAELMFASHNAAMADLDLGTGFIGLSGTVNNYANAAFAFGGGSASFGFSALDNAYVLDFGDILLGSGSLFASLDVLNDVLGPADLLEGSFAFDFGAAQDFLFSGFDPFADLAGGIGIGGLGVELASASMLGAFSDEIILTAYGSNASGYRDADGDVVRLLVRANVVDQPGGTVPIPATLWLMLIGSLGIIVAQRRTRRH